MHADVGLCMLGGIRDAQFNTLQPVSANVELHLVARLRVTNRARFFSFSFNPKNVALKA